MQYSISNLLNTITRHETENTLAKEIENLTAQIIRESRVAQLAKNAQATTQAKKRKTILEKQKAHHIIANAFLIYANQKQKSASLESLCRWLDSDNCTVEDKKHIAILAWRQYFDDMLQFQNNGEHIIPLASTFFYEPQKFTAFISWLLSNKASPNKIMNKKIFHKLFVMHVTSMESEEENILNEIYLNLLKIAEHDRQANTLLTKLITTSAGLQITTNYKIFDGRKTQYESHALLAPIEKITDEDNQLVSQRKKLTHKNQREVLTLEEINTKQEIDFNPLNQNIENFYQVFGTEFLYSLNLNIPHHRHALEIAAKQSDSALAAIFKDIQTNRIKFNEANTILSLLEEAINQETMQNGAPGTIGLTFHLFNFRETNNELIEQKFQQIVEENVDIHSVNEIRLLILALTSRIHSVENFVNSAICRSIQRYLFNHTLRHPIEINDELENDIAAIPCFELFAKQTIEKFKKELDEAFDHNDPLMSLLSKWGEQSLVFEFLNRNMGSIQRGFPKTVYDVWCCALKKAWLHLQQDGATTSFKELVEGSHFNTHDKDRLIRGLIEALFYVKIPELLEKITDYLDIEKINWRNKKHGQYTQICELAISKHNHILFDMVLKDTTSLDISNLFRRAVATQNDDALKKLMQSPHQEKISQSDVESIIRNSFHSTYILSAIFSDLPKDKHPSQELIHLIFVDSKIKRNWPMIEILAPYLEDKSLFNEAMISALNAGQWDTLLHFASNSQTFTDYTYCKILEVAQYEGQWTVINKLIQLPSRQLDQDLSSFLCESAVARKQWETVKLLLKLPEKEGPDEEIREMAIHEARRRGIDLTACVTNGPGLFSRSNYLQAAENTNSLNITG